jgi:hypothetical protein
MENIEIYYLTNNHRWLFNYAAKDNNYVAGRSTKGIIKYNIGER